MPKACHVIKNYMYWNCKCAQSKQCHLLEINGTTVFLMYDNDMDLSAGKKTQFITNSIRFIRLLVTVPVLEFSLSFLTFFHKWISMYL